MTILGQHTVAETRDAIKVTEFRVNTYTKQLALLQRNRQTPLTASQLQIDADMTAFVRKWTDVRDKVTLQLLASVLSNPNVAPFVLPAEPQFKAIDSVTSREEPRLVDIENRIDTESRALGLPLADQSRPAQDSPDADFAALKKLDAAIAQGEKSVKETAKSNTGLLIGAGVVGVVGIVVLTKIYL